MRVVRRAAALTLLGLTLGMPQALLAKARSVKARHEPGGATLNSVDLLRTLGRFLTTLGFKEGCGIDPLGRCAPSTPTTDTGAPTQGTEAGCGIDPLGACSPGH